MKFCVKCKKEFDIKEQKCPICGTDLKKINTDTDSEDEVSTIATMITLGLL